MLVNGMAKCSGTARFLSRYSEETMETGEDEAVIGLFVGILRLINNDPEASVASVSRLYPPAKTMQSHRLVPLQPGRPSSSSQSRPPATALAPIMDEFTSIWKCVLGFDGEIHPHDSFFDMGGLDCRGQDGFGMRQDGPRIKCAGP